MRIGVRGKLLLFSVALLAVALLAAELVLVPRLERTQLDSAQVEVTRLARAVAEHLRGTNMSPDDLQRLAVRLGRPLGVRVTLIGRDGVVLGESGEAPTAMENHGTRPEVAEALAGQVGLATRESATLRVRFLYAAIPPSNGSDVVTRVAMPLGDIDASVVRLRRSFRVAALIGVLVATLMSTLASYLASAPLLELEEIARSIARRDFSRRAHLRSDDEIGTLAGNLNTLSADLETTLDELERERERSAVVLHAMNEGILVTDSEGRVTGSNPALDRLLGSTGDLLGKSVSEVSRQPELKSHIRSVRNAGEPCTDEVEFTGSRARVIDLSSAPLPNGRGVVTTFHDVTAMRQLERVRQDFVANVSHELRTPVAAVQAAAETLLNGALDRPEHAREFTEIVGRNADRLARLVSDLLDLAKLDSGEASFTVEPIDLRTASSRALQSLQAKAGGRRIMTTIAVAEGVRVAADAGALDQILVNLFDNAIKYSPVGGEIGIESRAVGEGIEIAVWDQGPGIEPHHRSRVFERFYRVDPGRARELGGTGLGLSIVRHLVEGQGGQVTIDAQPGGGTRVVFVLPSAAA